MIRLRRGNVPRDGAVSGANSLITAPPLRRRSPAPARGGRPGTAARGPPPMTATVVPPARSAAAWAAASIPSARPETDRRAEPGDRVGDPRRSSPARPPSGAASRRSRRRADGPAPPADPRTYSTGGGSAIRRSRAG